MSLNYLLIRLTACVFIIYSFALPGIAQNQSEAVAQNSEKRIDAENDIYPVSSLINHNVKNMEREEIGTISDILFDPETGNLLYAILATGGFLGFNETHHVIPFSLIDQTQDKEYCIAKINNQKMIDAPKYDPEKQKLLNDSAFDKSIFAYYNTEAVSASHTVSWNKTSENTVVNNAAENFGKVSDMLYSNSENQVKFVTVSTSRSTDFDKDQILVPFKSVHFNIGDDNHIISASNDLLKNAPDGYNNDRTLSANVNDQDWQKNFNNYYNRKDYSKGMDDSQSNKHPSKTSRNIIGMKVQNSAGEEVGKVNDIHFDSEISKITSLTVSVGGFLGIGDQQFQIKRDKFTLNETGSILILNISNDEMLKLATN